MPFEMRRCFVLACLILSAVGRRVQHLLVDSGSAWQSFVELDAALVPSVPAARFGHPRVHSTRQQQPRPSTVLAPELHPRLPRSRMSAGGAVSLNGSDSFELELQHGLDHNSHAAPGNEGVVDSAADSHRSFPQLVGALVAAITARIALRSKKDGNPSEGVKRFKIDVSLLVCVALWYSGSYLYSITNKITLNAAGGSFGGFPVTIATAQMFVGALYSLFLWAAPDARPLPAITFADYRKMLPLAISVALQNALAVFALGAGAVSFAQIVKSSEPAFSAAIGAAVYGAGVSKLRCFTLIPIILGVILGSAAEINFAWSALITAALANAFAAVSRNEVVKVMATEGLKDRIGSVGNQFAITQINAFLFSIPLLLITEGSRFGTFVHLVKTDSVVRNNLIYSGLWGYLYSELATLAINKTNALSQSVLSALKRVILIVCVGLAMGETFSVQKIVGCSIAVFGTFLYSIVDKLFPPQARIDANADSVKK